VDFFEHQARASRATRWLVALFLIAVLVVTAAVTFVVAILVQVVGDDRGTLALPGSAWASTNSDLLLVTATGTLAFIFIASWYRLAQLRAGGSAVAEALGGVPVLADDPDPGRRRFYNVVEEMAIASSLPVPAVYVLEHESGINAFAAGLTPSDAAVAATRGCLDRLSRDELQGVVGHEFSHILHGDMRLNLRLMGYLFGILAVSLVGRSMMRAGGRRGFRSSSSRGRGTAVVLIAGLSLYVLGYAGVFVGRVIQSAVCRQREFLADASAVQYTRQAEGLAGALRKIAGLGRQSYLRANRAEEVSHMLFAAGRRYLAGLLATHPPVAARLAALGFAVTEPERTGEPIPAGVAQPGSAGFAPLTPTAVTDAVGNPGEPQMQFAAAIGRLLPAGILQAARARDGAAPLALALLLDENQTVRGHQLAIIEVRYGPPVREETQRLAVSLTGVSDSLYLSILDLTFPMLRTMSEARRDFLRDTAERLMQVDGRIDAFEAAVAESLRMRLDDLDDERQRRRPNPRDAEAAAETVLAALALIGHHDLRDAETAFNDGLAALGTLAPQVPRELSDMAPRGASVRAALKSLDSLAAMDKRTVVAALAAAAASDGRITGREAEILRAVCGTLHCPLPPLARRPKADADADEITSK